MMKKVIPKHILVIALFFAISLFQDAFAIQYNFQNYSIIDGISNKSIVCFYQDKKGFLWIGTTNGLNRYDGYQFKTFTNNPDDSLSLEGNIVYAIMDDKRGNLLLSTNAGFFVFNPSNESFHKIKIQGMNNFYMLNFCFDNSGNLWGLSNLKTLIQIDTATYKIRKTIALDSLYPNKNAGINFSLYFYDERLWIGGSLGITCFDYKHNKTTLITSDIDPMFMYLRCVKSGHKKNALLVVDGVRGLYEIDTRTLKCQHIPLANFKKLQPNLTYVTDAIYDNKGGIWVTASNGLFYVSPQGDIKLISPSTGSSFDFAQSEPNILFTDNDGNLWIGTMNDGVFACNNKQSFFTQISIKKAGLNGLPVNTITSHDNKIIASTKGGVFSFNRTRNLSSVDPKCLIDSSSHSVAFDKNNNLLIFTDEIVYSSDFTKKISVKAQMNMKYMHYGIFDSREIVWAAHWGWGVEGYNCISKKRYKIDIVPYDLQKNIVSSLYEDTDGSLWLASYGSGLVHVENPTSDKPKITIYAHKKDSNSISNDIILSIHDDGKGSIWLGTNGGGLNRFDKKNKRFEIYTMKNGLRSNVINAINSDLDGNIWFASTCLSKYNIKERTFTHFDLSDGINCKYFTGATFRDNDGILYFGDDDGILTFNPHDVKIRKDARIPVFTGVRLFGQPIKSREKIGDVTPFTVAIDYASNIALPYYLNTFSIEFASIQMLDNKNIIYTYKLEGVDDRWIQMPSGEHTATYSNLQPGTYLFNVKALYSSGISSQSRCISIVISPPWWKSLFFKISFLILVSTVLFVIIYSRLQKIKNQKSLLEEMVSTRTNELQYANKVLSDQSEELTEQSERLNLQANSLQVQNTMLEEQKKFIEMKNFQLNEAIESSDKLIGIIAHDFKNPLTAVYGLSTILRDNLPQLDQEHIKKYSDSIASASESLRNQMITVLDWVQNRDESLDAKCIEINIEQVLEDAIALLKETANQKNIRLTMHSEYETNCLIDPRMMSVVFRNLLNNAIKFTQRDGFIQIIIQELDFGIEVSFIDTGVGINKEKQQELFKNSNKKSNSYGTEDESGTGFGLQLCKTFVDKNNGTISFTSTEGEGSSFRVLLPKGQNKAIMIKNFGNVCQSINEPNKGKYSILIIDDNLEILEMMNAIFTPEYNVINAHDGKEGMFLALNMLPDIIICDIVLPIIDGLELCNMLKNQPLTSFIPILLISSQKNNDIQNLSYNAGATDFIEKPFNPFVLKQKIKSLIEIKIKLGQQIKHQIEIGGVTELPTDYNSKIINKVIKYIRENLSDEALDTNTIADKIGVSRSQLWRIFKNTTGKTLGDYIRDFRMQKAMEMLKTGKFKVSEIALEVGYSNPRYFIRTFTKEFGVSPTEYLAKTNKR